MTPLRADETAMVRVLHDIVDERIKQDAQWGGSGHDDRHSHAEWARFRGKFERLVMEADATREQERDALVKIAALAVAQIQSMDRFDNQPPVFPLMTAPNTPWTPDQPLREDASDVQIFRRLEHIHVESHQSPLVAVARELVDVKMKAGAELVRAAGFRIDPHQEGCPMVNVGDALRAFGCRAEPEDDG